MEKEETRADFFLENVPRFVNKNSTIPHRINDDQISRFTVISRIYDSE